MLNFKTVIKYQIIEDGIINQNIKETVLDDSINNYEDFIIIRSTFENRFKYFIRPKKDIRLISATQTMKKHFNSKSIFFLNGYQSWTDSLQYDYNYKLKDVTKLPKKILDTYSVDKYGESDFYKYQKNVLHAFDISYIKGINEFFIGSLDYKHAYLIIEYHLKKDMLVLNSDVYNQECKMGLDFKIFDYVIKNRIDEGVHEYVKYFEPHCNKRMFGYCTWYNHFQDINEEKIIKSINNSYIQGSLIQYDLYQIDDGWETFVGDWVADNNKFPNGLKPIVDLIHSKKMKAGIWIAPFVCEEKSKLYNDHYDWLKKDSDGKPYKCGSNWSGFYALDLENKEVRDYIEKSLLDLCKAGFDYFKLDFLYASNKGMYAGKSRCTLTYETYTWLRSILKDKIINGCGATILNGVYNFDFMRIGPDVSLTFDDKWYMKFLHRERISTKITMQNTIFRSFLNRHLFLCDPDVFVLRKNNNELSDKQKETLITINALYASLFMTSDEISEYSDSERKMLDKALYSFYNAYDVDFRRLNKKEILIYYNVKDSHFEYIYNTYNGSLREKKEAVSKNNYYKFK